jgi:DNA-binding CsgD family transcriptional regulator/tetratricopeptide (TPR) repeat protein
MLAAELLPNEALDAHAAVAAALAAGVVGDPKTGAIAARLAQHWVGAQDEARALPALVEAGRIAEAAMAFPEALGHYRAALGLARRAAAPLPGEGSPSEPVIAMEELLHRAAEMAALAGWVAEAVDDAREMTQLVDRARDPLRSALARERLGRFLWRSGDPDRTLAVLAEGASRVTEQPPSAGQARVLAAYARALALAGSPEEARQVSERAIDVARAAGSTADEAQARTSMGLTLSRLGRHERALEEYAAARETWLPAAGDLPRPSRILSMVEGYAEIARALARAGRAAESSDTAREAASLVRRLGIQPPGSAALALHHVERALASGAWDEADDLVRQLLDAPGPPVARASLLVTRARVATWRGRFADAAEDLEAGLLVLEDAGRSVGRTYWIAAAELGLWRGRLDEAHRSIDQGLAPDRDGGDPLPLAEILVLALRIEGTRADRARLRRAVAEVAECREAAESFTAQLDSLASTPAAGGLAEMAALRLTGEAERLRVDGEWRPQVWGAAADSWLKLDRPFLSAYARWMEAEAKAALRHHRDDVRRTAMEALAGASALGAAPLEEAICSLARRARIELGEPEHVEVPAATGPAATFGLTAREVEVLALVAEGRTNRQIATTLFITEKTAGHHVSNVLAKLGVASRVEAAALAHRAGLGNLSPSP